MEKDKKEEGSFVNQDLNTAFVQGELNKTVTANSNQNSNWNLLDDPQMETIKGEEEQQEDKYHSNFLDVTQKEMKGSKNMGGMQSSIQFKNKDLMASTLPKKNADDDQDDDLKDLLSQVFKKP